MIVVYKNRRMEATLNLKEDQKMMNFHFICLVKPCHRGYWLGSQYDFFSGILRYYWSDLKAICAVKKYGLQPPFFFGAIERFGGSQREQTS